MKRDATPHGVKRSDTQPKVAKGGAVGGPRTGGGSTRSAEDISLDKEAGARLRAIREFADVSRKTVADIFGKRESVIGHWETGFRSANILDMKRLCERYGVTLDFIYRGHTAGLAPGAKLFMRRMHPELIEEERIGTAARNHTDPF